MGHPSLDIVSTEGTQLAGRRIVLCVSGSVAAYKAIELARMLMRRGATVTCVASSAATRLIRPDYLKWATGNRVITRLTGELEHVRIADYGRADMIVVYPCTANTLGKLANGIDDAPVSTVLTVGFGAGIPVMIAPAMHRSMYENPAVRRNVEFLRGRAELVDPVFSEGKARAAEPAEVMERILGRLGASRGLEGRRALVVAGPTVERIDPVRAVTNISSGTTGVLVAEKMLGAGARVCMVYGPGTAEPPPGARVVRVTGVAEMAAAVRKELGKKYDIVVMAAAAADYVPRPSRAKIGSGRAEISVRMKRAPKILDMIKRARPGAFLVGFKAEAGVSARELERRARRRMAEAGADMMVANDVGDPRYARDPSRNDVLIIGPSGTRRSGRTGKGRIAAMITREVEKGLQ